MPGWKIVLRPGACAGLLALAIWLIMPTEAMAQQGCMFNGGTCTFPTGSYSTQLLQQGTNGGYYEIDVNAGTTVTVDPAASGSFINSAALFQNNAPAGTESAPAGTVAAGLTVVNNGSLTLQTASSGLANTSFTGLYSSVVGGDGYTGNTPGNAGFATAPLNVTNNGTITLSFLNADVLNGAALYALAAGGHGGCNSDCLASYDSTVGGNGGSSAGVTVTNTGTINAQVGTQGGGGQNGFAGIAALSIGGNAGRGDNAATGGGSGFATVTNSAPVTVDFGWSADPAGSSIGVYGIQALTQGGNGTGAKGSYSLAGAGGHVGSASVTLTSGGTVAVTATGAPPQAGIGSGPLATIMGAGVAAEAIGGNGGNGEEENSNAGRGGDTQDAPTITITDANVTASGTGLAGLLALSQGGAGGLGATQNAGNTSGSAYSDGGSGGSASGPSVTVAAQTQTVTISTNGNNSPALAAFALGGAGGKVNENTHTDGHNTGTTGGAGGEVSATSVTLTGSNGHFVDLATNGDTSPGLYVVSQGGTGGYGGDFDSGLSHGGGGSGGTGGNGGDVAVTLQSAGITTQGSASPGIVAQSQGGVAGGGGTADGGPGSNAGGGGGNGGGTGGVGVSLDSASTITTTGTDSSAIVAQALSGAGGVGGDVDDHLEGQGGNGGAGGNAGSVTATNDGMISTSGDNARGILAQSLAGAGGSGGTADGYFNTNGGAGGSSGQAGAVTVNNFGAITTSGSDAQGIVAQSIGGGGGAGGSATGLGAVGGTGALAAAGNAVTVNLQGSIATSGLSSAGVLGQSIGGGGGDGGGASGGVITLGGSGAGGGAGGAATFCSGGSSCPGGGSQITTNGDYSPAVLMQSIGGGGGHAGNASSSAPFLSIAVGGQGGGGGGGGSVVLDTSQTNITTVGTKSPGLVAQSIGGGGGMGGNAVAKSVGVGIAAAVSVGGNAGGGGDGGSVLARVQQEAIATGQSPQLLNGNPPCMSPPCAALPVDSYGVVVQSIGGGGGLGGSAVAKAVAISVPVPDTDLEIGFGAAATVGGQGGSGGKGGTAQFQLSNGGLIKTSGQGSTGVLLQSVGGGGGAGGDSSSMAAVIGAAAVSEETTSINLAVNFALGGTAGGGGDGGTVNAALGGTISSSGTLSADPSGSAPTAIVTYGDFANGIIAQSIGGGGGNAGYGSGNTQAFGAGNDITVNVALGGKGGSGGDGGAVNAALFPGNGITTYGSGAVGMMAQSIGGGGGASQGDSFGFAAPIKGGSSYIVGATLNLGVSGPTGGDGGPVTVSVDAPITTHGGDATGVLAQSIGGGGGLAGSAGADASADNPVTVVGNARQAGSNLNGALKGDTPVQATFTTSIGGTGGTGGDGNAVTANIQGPITTAGDWANGVVAQSIGGGGGKGGSAAATGTGGIPAITVNADVAIGGKGGGGGQGGQVAINLGEGGFIGTAGFGATGLIGQSVGGGGGIGADGSDAAAGTLSVGAAFGGSGGQGGAGSAVTLGYLDSAIVTTGAAADGVELQSIGGSGGIAGAGSSLFFQSAGNWQPMGSLTLSAGGGSASSGDGGVVTFWPQGQPQQQLDPPLLILTRGNDSFGILAQSIGGGGGLVTSQPTGSSYALAIGGNTSGGNGGDVVVELPGNSTIQTTGIGAHGLVAQSIGGGGGVIRVVNTVGDTPALTTSMAGLTSYKTNGNGGAVSVSAGGTIQVSGAGAIGILAQSVGGGGGLVMKGGLFQAGTTGQSGSSGWGDQVEVITTGSVFATGQNGIGIFAQSTGPSTPSNGPIVVAVGGSLIGAGGPGGSVVGGSGSGATYTTPGSAGIVVDSPPGGQGSAVLVSPGGLVTTLLDTDGTAILASGGGSANVTNDGTITGSVLLNGGTGGLDAFNDGLLTNHGTLNAGATVDADVVNSGTVNVGRPGTPALQTTTVTGDFTQTGEGRLGVTVDSLNRTTGHLQVDGTATLDGKIVPTAITLLPGALPVVTAGHLVSTADGADVQLFHWDTAQSGNTLSLSPRRNFKPGGVSLTESQSSLAGYFGRAWDNGDKAFATRFAELSRIGDGSGYKAALDAWSSKAAHAQSIALAGSVGTILGAAMSCPVFVDDTVLLGEDNCVWAKVTGRWTDQSANGNTQGYHVSGTTYRIGAQHEIAPDWYLGASLGFGQSWTTVDGGSSGNGDTYDGSVTLKRVMGPWQFAGSMAFAGGSFESYRRVDIPGITSGTLKSEPSIFLAGGRLRAAYEFAFDDWYIRPYGDLDVVYSELPGFEEKGDDLSALDVHDSSKTSVALSPMVEFGGRLDLDPETTLRAYAAFGVSYQPDNTRTIHSSFVGASSANDSFSDQIDSPEMLGRIDVGVQLFRAGGFELKGEYTADVGDSFLSQSASARFAYHF
ncbi:hypothetical protein [Inquilinus sp. CA228]|uniref:hypothetical protein n=1 Tax=Inquilinus sp. CA228 TaxID=3455609 RepID=UPI003F8D4BA9